MLRPVAKEDILPHTIFGYLVYTPVALFLAIAVKVGLRYRADRHRCVFCDGARGNHAPNCHRPRTIGGWR